MTNACLLTRFVLTLLLFATLNACAPSGPATQYYSLFYGNANTPTARPHSQTSQRRIGIGPVELPGYLDNTSIVSRRGAQQVAVSGFHAWAEPLDDAIARVAAMAIHRARDDVTTTIFPWDSRNRPQQQLRLRITRLDGVVGGMVEAQFTWTLFDLENSRIIASDRINMKTQTKGKGYAHYIQAINDLTKDISEAIALRL